MPNNFLSICSLVLTAILLVNILSLNILATYISSSTEETLDNTNASTAEMVFDYCSSLAHSHRGP